MTLFMMNKTSKDKATWSNRTTCPNDWNISCRCVATVIYDSSKDDEEGVIVEFPGEAFQVAKTYTCTNQTLTTIVKKQIRTVAIVVTFMSMGTLSIFSSPAVRVTFST